MIYLAWHLVYFRSTKSIHKGIEADEVSKDPSMVVSVMLQLQTLLNSDNNQVHRSIFSDPSSSKRNIILERKMKQHTMSSDSVHHIIIPSHLICGIRRSRVAMGLCLKKSRSAGTGAAPVVWLLCRAMPEWQSLPQCCTWKWCLQVELVGCCCVSLFVHLTQAVVSLPLSAGCDLVLVSSGNDPWQGLPIRYLCQGPSCLFYRHLWIGVGGGPEFSCLLRARHTAGPWGSYRTASCGANSKHWFTTSFLQPALVYVILPSTTAVFSYP